MPSRNIIISLLVIFAVVSVAGMRFRSYALKEQARAIGALKHAEEAEKLAAEDAAHDAKLSAIRQPIPRTTPLNRAQCQPLIAESLAAYERAMAAASIGRRASVDAVQSMLIAQDDLMYATASLLVAHSDLNRRNMLSYLARQGNNADQEARNFLHANETLLLVPHAGDDGNLRVGYPAALTGPVKVLEVFPNENQARIRLDYGDRFYDWRIRYELTNILRAGEAWPDFYDVKLTPIIVPLVDAPKGGVGEALVISPPHKLNLALEALGKKGMHFFSMSVVRNRKDHLAETLLVPQSTDTGLLLREKLKFANWPLEQ
jgi:hypothetical protein